MARKPKPIPLPQELKRQIGQLFHALENGPDLSCALVGAAFLDHCLASMLQSFLVDGETSKGLLSPSGALGEFSARWKLTYSLGLTQKSIGKELEKIGQIRNRFAHGFFDVRFSDKEIEPICNKLLNHKPRSASARDKYAASVMMLATDLLLLCSEIKQQTRKPERDYPIIYDLTRLADERQGRNTS
jgi:DNA-binding MltR family transcriptional regulator